MPKTYSFDQFQREAAPDPFVLEFDDRDNIVIPAPDALTLMQAEEAGTTRKFLETLCGSEWSQVSELVEGLSTKGLMRFVRTMTQHFGISADQVPDEGKRRS